MSTSIDETVSDVRKAAAALGPQILAAADEIEQGRRLPSRIAQAMKECGVFGMAMPQAWGGAGLDPLEQLRVIETLARFDASAGWCAMIGIDGGWYSSYLGQDVARELFGDANAATASSILFAGNAKRVAGGYLVNGRWPFVSGCQHSECWVFTCNVFDQEGTRIPEMRLVYVRASKGQVLDTWYSTGLRGSGSHDVDLKDVFVPETHTIDFPHFRSQRPGPLWAFPLLFLYMFPGVALGVARAAIDAFIDIANRREITIAALGGQRALLRTSASVQSTVARAEGLVRSSRSHVFDVMNEIWTALSRGEPLSPIVRASYSIAVTNAHRNCTEAVDLLFKANGGSSVYSRGPLDRCFRDIHTINQHHLASLAFDEKAGQVLLGLEPGDQFF
jgi:alkylation response protein AidB-like acyl-CoA dehydrogenase